MRILFLSNVIPNPLRPTKGVFNLGLIRALIELGHELEVISPIAWTDWILSAGSQRRQLQKQPGRRAGIAVHYPVYFYPPGILRTAYGWFMWRGVAPVVRDALDRLQPHAVVAYWAHPDGDCAVRAARQAGIPAIVMVGGSDVLLLTANRSRRRVIERVLHDAQAIVTVSDDLRRRLVARGLSGRRISVVRRGIDADRFHPGDRQQSRRRLAFDDRPILLWAGRMERVKGLPVLLDALQRLKQDGVAFQMILVGSGQQSSALAADAKRRGLVDRVHWPGVIPHQELADYYRAADMVVLPSLSEGVPNVLLESMACGTPFVASRVGGIPEIATPGIDHLVPPGDAAALAAAIRQQIESPASTIRRTFVPDTWPVAAQRLVDVVEPLVDAGATAHPQESSTCLKPSIA